MAKKDPTDLSVEEKLKTLYQLQTTLSAIDDKKALRGELPLEVQDLEDEIAGLTIRIEKIQTDIKDFQAAILQKKAEINEAQASVDRYQNQLNEVKNNREYDTLTKEIEYQTLEIELCNKKIREAMIKVEEKKRDMEMNEEIIKDRQVGDIAFLDQTPVHDPEHAHRIDRHGIHGCDRIDMGFVDGKVQDVIQTMAGTGQGIRTGNVGYAFF